MHASRSNISFLLILDTRVFDFNQAIVRSAALVALAPSVQILNLKP